jgi:hypothetical protein
VIQFDNIVTVSRDGRDLRYGLAPFRFLSVSDDLSVHTGQMLICPLFENCANIVRHDDAGRRGVSRKPAIDLGAAALSIAYTPIHFGKSAGVDIGQNAGYFLAGGIAGAS